MKEEKSDLGGDYTTIPVPYSERRHWVDVALVWMGMNICPPTLLLGVWLMRYESFYSANISLLIGLLFLSFFSIVQGFIGTDTGLPTYPLSKLAFGEIGGRLFSFIMFIALVGWFGILTETAISTLYSQVFTSQTAKDLMKYKPLFSFGFGLVVTAICFFGFKAIAWLNRITIPGLIFLSLFALYKIMENKELIENIIGWKPETKVSELQGAVWVIGSLIIAALTSPDFQRYSKSRKETIYSVILGNLPIVYFLTVMGMAFSVLSGAASGKNSFESADLSAVFVKQSWNIGPVSGGLIAGFILVGAIITTNVVNLYPGGMALTTVLEGSGKYFRYLEDRAVLTIVVGIFGSISASFGIVERFEKFLELLTEVSIPLLGIMIVDYFFLKNRSIKGRVNKNAIFVWVFVSAVLIFGKPYGGAIGGVFYSGVFYYILEKVGRRNV